MSKYTVKDYCFFALNHRKDKLFQHEIELMAKTIMELKEVSKEILNDFDDESVQINTPICYGKKFEILRNIVNKI